MKYVAGVVAWVIAGFIVVGAVIGPYTNTQDKTCTVIDKDRTTGYKGTSDMRVYTEQCGTLKVGDMWLIGLFNSADLYSKIEVGRTYRFEVSGYRVGLLSSFPNIREVAAP